MTATHKALACAALALSACATTPPLTTPSGKPEVIVSAKTQQEAIDNVAASCATRGFAIENQTSTMVTCSKVSNVMTQALLGNGSYGSTQNKFQYAALRQGDKIKVMMSSAWIEASQAFGGVTRNPIDLNNPRIGKQLQQDLIIITGGTSAEVIK